MVEPLEIQASFPLQIIPIPWILLLAFGRKFRVILNLSSKIPALNSDSPKKTISSIDIDVISDNFEIVDLASLYNLIDKVHNIEKITFFNLLQEDFLKSLNPQY